MASLLSTDQIYQLNRYFGKAASLMGLGDKLAGASKFSGKLTTVGGAATEAFTVTGLLATDVVLVTLQTKGATPREIVRATPSANTLTIEFSGDPAADHIVAYSVVRT